MWYHWKGNFLHNLVYPNGVAKNENSKNGIFFGKRMVSITVVYTGKDTLP